MKCIISTTGCLFLMVLLSCSGEKYSYDNNSYFTKQQRDTLFIDIVTRIGKKPESADYTTRLDPKYRAYYQQLSAQYSMEFFHKERDTFYYYMIRPARSTRGDLRGVGGKLTLGKTGKIKYFEESFNTPVYNRKELHRIGKKIFTELVQKQSIDELLWNVDYIEWPDGRLKYDTSRYEWRYDVSVEPETANSIDQ